MYHSLSTRQPFLFVNEEKKQPTMIITMTYVIQSNSVSVKTPQKTKLKHAKHKSPKVKLYVVVRKSFHLSIDNLSTGITRLIL